MFKQFPGIDNYAIAVFFLLAGWAAGRLALVPLIKTIESAGFVRCNYRGERIPLGIGVVFFIGILPVLVLARPFLQPGAGQRSELFLLAVAGYTILGLIDDYWGSRSSTGLRGHFKKLLSGSLTTGAIKALAGGILALYIASVNGLTARMPVDALVIALSVNMINLLDLRPGRAGKFSLVIFILLMLVFYNRPETAFLALMTGCLLAYLPVDLRARAMMGDAGSNALGAAVGISAAWFLNVYWEAVYLAVLIIIHVVAEKHSLTGIIAKNRLLNYLDNLGRG